MGVVKTGVSRQNKNRRTIKMSNELTLYAPFIKEIKELIYRHQYEAMKKVNIELLMLYWKIGHRIDLRQRKQG